MTTTKTVSVPEQTIRAVLQAGVDTISEDPSLLDGILTDLSTADLTSLRAKWTTNPPRVMSGYARAEGPFPQVAVTLGSEQILQDYIGLGEETMFLGDGDDKIGRRYHRRLKADFQVHVYAEHPDVCAWYYRVFRRIMNVGIERFVHVGLQDPVLSGMELVPDPRFVPDNVFIRRITLSVEYEEDWSDQDGLARSLLERLETYLSGDGALEILHEDQGGGVVPYSP